MRVYKRHYNVERDEEYVVKLLVEARAKTNVERYPTVWRLRLLLDSRLWEPERDAQIWVGENNELAGFALLSRRNRESPSTGLEWIVSPHIENSSLLVQMLEWAQMRTLEIARERGVAISLSLALGEDDDEKRLFLELNGFSLIQDGYDWYMACSLQGVLIEPTLPQGFNIRAVNAENEREIVAYEQIYGFAPVRRSHRLMLLHSPEYCHLAIVGPDGTLVAYCEVSISRKEWEWSGQRVGWIDYVQTSEHFQRQGLGKAITLASLHQLQTWGADRALLITRSDNISAQLMFKSAGFSYKERDFYYIKVIYP